jgi:hypothetical protein
MHGLVLVLASTHAQIVVSLVKGHDWEERGEDQSRAGAQRAAACLGAAGQVEVVVRVGRRRRDGGDEKCEAEGGDGDEDEDPQPLLSLLLFAAGGGDGDG